MRSMVYRRGVGFVALCAGVIALGISLVPGIIAVIVHKRGRDKGHGSWPIFIAIALVTTVLCVGVAFLLMKSFEDSTGAPSEDEYMALLMSFAICFAGPGLGMSLGAFALLKRGPSQGPLPPRG